MPPELESLWGILEEYFMLEVVPQWDLSVRFEDVALGKTSRGRRILHGTANTPVFSRRSGNYLKKSSENKALLKAVEQTESGCVLRLATCGFSSTSLSFRASAVSFIFYLFIFLFFLFSCSVWLNLEGQWSPSQNSEIWLRLSEVTIGEMHQRYGSWVSAISQAVLSPGIQKDGVWLLNILKMSWKKRFCFFMLYRRMFLVTH